MNTCILGLGRQRALWGQDMGPSWPEGHRQHLLWPTQKRVMDRQDMETQGCHPLCKFGAWSGNLWAINSCVTVVMSCLFRRAEDFLCQENSTLTLLHGPMPGSSTRAAQGQGWNHGNSDSSESPGQRMVGGGQARFFQLSFWASWRHYSQSPFLLLLPQLLVATARPLREKPGSLWLCGHGAPRAQPAGGD